MPPMSNLPEKNGLLEALSQSKEFIAAMFVIMSAACGVWWRDKRKDKARISALEVIAVSQDKASEANRETAKILISEVQQLRIEAREDAQISNQSQQDIMKAFLTHVGKQ